MIFIFCYRSIKDSNHDQSQEPTQIHHQKPDPTSDSSNDSDSSDNQSRGRRITRSRAQRRTRSKAKSRSKESSSDDSHSDESSTESDLDADVFNRTTCLVDQDPRSEVIMNIGDKPITKKKRPIIKKTKKEQVYTIQPGEAKSPNNWLRDNDDFDIEAFPYL